MKTNHRIHEKHDHQHGPDCGHTTIEHEGHEDYLHACAHDAVPHGDHVDYVVNGHLHHPHEKHCDDHGAVQLARS